MKHFITVILFDLCNKTMKQVLFLFYERGSKFRVREGMKPTQGLKGRSRSNKT